MKKKFLIILFILLSPCLFLTSQTFTQAPIDVFEVEATEMKQEINTTSKCIIIWYKHLNNVIVRIQKPNNLQYDEYEFQQIYKYCLDEWFKKHSQFYNYSVQKEVTFFNKVVNGVPSIVFETTIVLEK
jgi:hypothetical protein